MPDTHSFFSNFPRVIPSAKSETHFPKSVQGAQFIYNEIANAFCMPSLLKTFYDSVFDSKNETDLAAIISPFSLALSPQDFIKQTQYGLKHLKSPLDYFLDLPDEKAFPICNAFITDPKTYDWGPFFLAYMGYDVCAKNTFTFDSALTGTIKTDTLMKRFLSKAGKTPPAERHRGAPITISVKHLPKISIKSLLRLLHYFGCMPAMFWKNILLIKALEIVRVNCLHLTF